MSVELWFEPSTRFPGGHKAVYATRDEALAQAAHDIEVEHFPAPARIEYDGKVESIKDALAPAKE